jgi:hypothetical protein
MTVATRFELTDAPVLDVVARFREAVVPEIGWKVAVEVVVYSAALAFDGLSSGAGQVVDDVRQVVGALDDRDPRVFCVVFQFVCVAASLA